MSFAAAALGLGANGFRVHPLRARSKVPIIDGWPDAATDDPEQIQRWWQAYPQANIGIATGRGIVVLDVDGRVGVDSMRALRLECQLAETLTAKTGSGWHYYYRVPLDLVIGNSTRKLGPGLDVKCENGQVVAPPSIHPDGGTYLWARPGEIADAGPKLLAALRALRIADVERSAYAYVEGAPIPVGVQETTLTSRAGQLRRAGLDVAAIFAELQKMNCVPPMHDRDMMRIAKSIGSKPAGEVPGAILGGIGIGIGIGIGRSPRLRRGDTIEEKATDWIWYGYLPVGALVVQDGEPGEGKSTIWVDLAARITGGLEMPLGMPNLRPTAGDVILMMNEDSPEATIMPEFNSIPGSDHRRLHILEGTFSIRDDLVWLEKVVQELRPAMVVIDPITAHLGSKIDLNRDNEIRDALNPLLKLAEDYRFVIGANRHVGKGKEGKSAQYRGLGSVGIIAVARAGWICAADRDDTNKPPQRILAPLKYNLSIRPSSLRYALESAVSPKTIATKRITWLGTSEKDEHDLAGDDRRPSALAEAKRQILQLLDETIDDDGWCKIAGLAGAYGHKPATWTNAGTELKLAGVIEQSKAYGWRLPR